MRKIIVLEHISLDGVIQGPGGPDLHVWGSGNLVRTLMKHDLVDSFRLMIYPLVLGKGKRLFAEGATPMAFTVKESLVTKVGVMVAEYERAGTVATGTY